MSYGSDTWAKWVLNEDKALPLLKAAWDAGIQTWDTANVYSNVYLAILVDKNRASRSNLLPKPSRNIIFQGRNL
jgi:aryl-alcohol dehydrogenase-like predicted oxidoreductase